MSSEEHATARQASLPLDGVRVLDLTRVLAGPHCTALLGDLGAEVIKVEHPVGGDESRYWTPRHGEQSGAYMAVNRNKRGVAIDLGKPAARELVRDFATQCDVLVENFRVGSMERWELDYATLAADHPRLVSPASRRAGARPAARAARRRRRCRAPAPCTGCS